MKTRFLTSITTQFNPHTATRAHRLPRLLLSRLPSTPTGAGGNPLILKTTILPKDSREPASAVLAFKNAEPLQLIEATRGGKTIKELPEGWLDLGRMGMKDVLEEFERRARRLTRAEMISG